MEFVGTIKDIAKSYTGRETIISFSTMDNIQEEYEKLKGTEKIVVGAKRFAKKRSLNANAYMWCLLKELAEAKGTTNVEEYKYYVKDYGIFRDVQIDSKSVETMIYSWSMQGIAWIADVLDYSENAEYKTLRLYYGTSVYNNKQMARILNAVVEDCKAGGITTKEDLEIERMVKEWAN